MFHTLVRHSLEHAAAMRPHSLVPAAERTRRRRRRNRENQPRRRRRRGVVFLFSLHETAFSLLHPRIVLLVRGVDEGVALLVFLNVFLHPEKRIVYILIMVVNNLS